MHQDFKELLSAFNAGQVRYLIVGGYAVSTTICISHRQTELALTELPTLVQAVVDMLRQAVPSRSHLTHSAVFISDTWILSNSAMPFS
jgi:hypothetical protein